MPAVAAHVAVGPEPRTWRGSSAAGRGVVRRVKKKKRRAGPAKLHGTTGVVGAIMIMRCDLPRRERGRRRSRRKSRAGCSALFEATRSLRHVLAGLRRRGPRRRTWPLRRGLVRRRADPVRKTHGEEACAEHRTCAEQEEVQGAEAGEEKAEGDSPGEDHQSFNHAQGIPRGVVHRALTAPRSDPQGEHHQHSSAYSLAHTAPNLMRGRPPESSRVWEGQDGGGPR